MVDILEVTSKDGTLICSVKSGSGPPLLLVHGASADHNRWSGIAPRLEQQFTVYAMDRRGRGKSSDGAEYHFRREVEDVTAVVDALDEPASVLGHSFGGLCSLEAALLTDNISRLILYEPPLPPDHPPIPPGLIERMQALVEKGDSEDALELFLRELVKMPEYELEEYRSLPMWNRRVALAATVVRELGVKRSYHFDAARYAGIQIPVMLLLGGDSPSFARRAVESIHAALPDSRITLLPGQQHIAMDTSPDLFVREVQSFLNGHQRR